MKRKLSIYRQFLEFYTEHCCDNERKISVQVIGNALADVVPKDSEAQLETSEDLEERHKHFDHLAYVDFTKEPKGNLITDLMEFKNGLEVYPVTKTNN